MFDIGWGELLVIGVVALVAIGPKELPTVLRTLGQWMAKLRRMASEFQGQFQEAMREAEMSEKLKARFPSVTALHYPNSGTHFHCYVALNPTRDGEARQIMLALLGWDPYLKTVIAVDSDIDLQQDEQVLWAMATHFQPHQDLFMIDGLPGSPLDPSSSVHGTTSRMGIDATRGASFEGIRARLDPAVIARASDILRQAGVQS